MRDLFEQWKTNSNHFRRGAIQYEDATWRQEQADDEWKESNRKRDARKAPCPHEVGILVSNYTRVIARSRA